VASEAQVAFNPRKEWQILNFRLQGYYKADFRNPLTLDSGRYWLVMEKAPEDPSRRRRGTLLDDSRLDGLRGDPE